MCAAMLDDDLREEEVGPTCFAFLPCEEREADWPAKGYLGVRGTKSLEADRFLSSLGSGIIPPFVSNIVD